MPLLPAFYAKMSASGRSPTAKLKSDATFFSIADGIVQHIFIEHLFSGNKFAQIVGEEDETKVNIRSKPYTVDDLLVPQEFEDLIDTTLAKVKSLASSIDSSAYKKLTLFVDPIDGTREFATGKGEFVTILIGYNDEQGKPVAGIVYKPLTQPAYWAAGAKSENCIMGHLDSAPIPNHKGCLVTDGKVSPFLSSVIDELGYQRIGSLASGNRALMLLEGKAGAYIRDTGGFAKWDTSGPQAVFEAYGFTMSKLPEFLRDKKLTGYTHLKTETNLDFIPGIVNLTLYNAKDKLTVKKDEQNLVDDVHLVKEYACLMGLVALDKHNLDEVDKVHAAMLKVQRSTPPSFT